MPLASRAGARHVFKVSCAAIKSSLIVRLPPSRDPPTNMVSCMQVGSNNMPANLTTDFGPDLQPYFGGRPYRTAALAIEALLRNGG